MPPSPGRRMASKQAAAKRAPAKSRNTGKRKTAKPRAVVTSTPLTCPRPHPTGKSNKAVPDGAEPAEDDEAPTDIFEVGNVSLFDIANQVDADDLLADHEVFDETDSIFNDDEKEEETDGDVDTHQFFQFSCYHDLFHSFCYSTGPVIDIAFEVLYKNAFRDLIIKSNISFPSFLTRVAEKMETSIIHRASIGYILPWKVPRTGKPIAKLLEDEEAFGNLINNIWQYIEEQKAKNKGKGKVKPFCIQVVDMADTADKVRLLSDQSRSILIPKTGCSWKEKSSRKACC